MSTARAHALRRPGGLRPTDAVVRTLSHLGVTTGVIKVLTVPGRTTGAPHSTPVSPVLLDGRRSTIAPIPQGDWVRDARAAGRGRLTDGPRIEQVLLRELHATDEADLRRAVMTAFPATVADQVTAFEVTPAPTSRSPEGPRTPMTTDDATSAPSPSSTQVTEVVLPGRVGPDGFVVRQRTLPAPGRGQVLVAVEATGISFAEHAMRLGRYPGQPKFPFVPGYDLVGTTTAVGARVDPTLVGQRVAAMTKTGGWATHVLLEAADVVPVPAGLDPAEVETLVVSGLTAYRMLHRTARVRAGQTVLVHGANGGVGTTLVQLAQHAGARVIGTSSPRHHGALRDLGVLPVDYDDPDLPARVREIAPEGVDAVFDHIGGASIARSWSVLAEDGHLVSYALLKDTGPMVPAFFALLTHLAWLSARPGRRRAGFFDVWAGHVLRPRLFRARLHEDLAAVFALLGDGTLRPQVAARLPLTRIREAVELAESRTVVGKVVLLP